MARVFARSLTGFCIMILCMNAAPSTARTQVVPDPTFSICPAAIHVGDGSCCDTFYIRDQFNNPINGSNVTLDFGSCPGVSLSPSQAPGFVVAGSTITGKTDTAGRVIFCTRGSGSCTGTVKSYADGVQICSFAGASSCIITTPSLHWSWGRIRSIYR